MRRNYLKLIVIFLTVFSHQVSAGIVGHWFNKCQSLGAKKVNIHTIQGSDDVSPLLGQDVEVQGIITAVAPQLKGFFIQEEAEDMDGNPKTSEGLFVFSQILPDIEVGHIVSVRGKVQEHFGMTQMRAIGVSRPCGKEEPSSFPLILPLADTFDWESIEGMKVVINEPTVVLNTYHYTRYNQLTIGNQLLMQPTEIHVPESQEVEELKALNARSKVIIDDLANGAPSIQELLIPIHANNSLRIGSRIESVSGVVDFSFEQFRIRMTEVLRVKRAPRPAMPELEAPLKIASFNVLNLFNGDGLGGGFPTKRGADTMEEYSLQLEKIINTLIAMDADVIGLNELENDGFGPESSIAQLTNALNTKIGENAYDYIGKGQEVYGSDTISVGILYRPNSVTPVDQLNVLTSQNSPADEKGPLFDSRRNRPSFTQLFADNRTQQRFVVNVNHLKSKGSPCGPDDDSEQQANCNGTRTRAAEGLSHWLKNKYPTQPIFIVGDLNSYAMEDPLTTFAKHGFSNLVHQFNDGSYTYSFRGEIGTLDYVLANTLAKASITDAIVWNANAAEPVVFDYNDTLVRSSKNKRETFRNSGPYRASDHDAVIIGISF